MYIDGLNFYYGAVKRTPHKWVDFEALARTIVPKDTIECIRYFTARVTSQDPNDRPQERQNALIRALLANPLIDVKLGHFRRDTKWRPIADDLFSMSELFRPELLPDRLARWMFRRTVPRRTDPFMKARVHIDEEKGSDVNLGSYLLYDALTGASEKAIVISNDSDLAEPVRLVAGRGVPVGIVNPHRGPTSRHLRKAATFEIPFHPNVVAKCQLPNTVRDSKGREVHRPREWR